MVQYNQGMENRNLTLEKSILATLCYFDVFDYPLTSVEIWKWLLMRDNKERTVEIFEIIQVLEKSEFLKKRVEVKQGFYFLKGRAETVSLRKERYKIAEHKFQKAIKIARLLRHIPFVIMIAVCNTLAFSNSRDGSDIDLFIITDRNRIWQTRFWVTGFLKLFRLRPSVQKTKDTICASFFIDEMNLNLESLTLDGDIYLPYWMTQVFPLYNEGVYEQFLAANNWVKERLVNYLSVKPAVRRQIAKQSRLKKAFSFFAAFLPESIFKKYQWRILPRRLKEMANKDSRVVVQDHMLKFHDNDRRELFLTLFQKRLASVMNE